MPEVLVTAALFARLTPFAFVEPARPVPKTLIAPAPDSSCALSSDTPCTRAPVPIAAVVSGLAPPPSVMFPPLLLITVPELSWIAPPAKARSAFNTMV
ncbi:MAG: hypothetical protein ACYC6M_11535 [Terriglobales bacterium]